MSNNRALPTARCPLMFMTALALGLASQVPTALAQGQPDKPAAASEPGAAPPQPGGAASEPSGVEGVTVTVPRPLSSDLSVPPDKAAALAAEAAQDAAWRAYRKSTPPLTPNPNDLSKDFPGLQTYIPQ